MFGHDDDDVQQDNSVVNPTVGMDASNDVTTPSDDTNVTPVTSHDDATTPSDNATPSPSEDVPPTPEPTSDPVVDTPAPDTEPATTPDDAVSTDDADLLELKKQALEQLSPLIDKLDQTAEEKFKTTMMMIQATDSAHLVKNAYEAATAITDEKVRAQALLDIVNEINYFTQNQAK